MALRRAKTQELAVIPHEQPRSLVAAAAQVNLTGRSWRTYRFGSDEWQTEAWRLYDIVGELHFVANWMGSACSRVRIYVAEVDEYGRIKKEVTSNKKIAGLSDQLFGSPVARAEALRAMAINLTVAGDVYNVGRSRPGEDDEWMVVSCNELKRYGSKGNVIAQLFDADDEASREVLDPKTDVVIRIWTPHPRRHLWPDSPTRAAMPMLWEIERLTRFVFAQIDSRLVSAGLMFIPKEVSFPDTDDPNLSGAEQLTERLTKAGSVALQGAGTAAGVVPTFVEMPMDALGKIQLIQFTSELSKEALNLRKEAIERFALAMDIDPMVLHGAGDANHWGATQITEGQVKIHVEPMLTRIVDGWTKGILRPALKRAGEDPDKYIYWYDTAPLTVRPQRLQDTLGLWKEHLVSSDAVRDAGNYREGDIPTDEEELKYFTRELMTRDPNLFQIPAVRKVAGYTDAILPPDQVTAPGAPPPAAPEVPPTGIEPTATGLNLPSEPANSTAANAPGGPAGPNASTAPPAVVASATVPTGVFAVANATVFRAMEIAGKRLLDRPTRNKWPDTAPHELHTKIPVTDDAHAAKLLAGAWDHLALLSAPVAPDLDTLALRESLDLYCTTLLTHSHPHGPDLLQKYLYQQGFLDVA